jgi:hypothetical protein
MEYYVYALLDTRKPHPDFGFEPFYIGKGKGDRAEKHLLITDFEKDSNPRKVYKINSVRRSGKEPKCIKIKENLQEDDAYNIEMEFIKKYGRIDIDKDGLLTNICIDSRPPSRIGATISKEQKQAISRAAKKRLSGKTYEEIFGNERAKIVKQNVGMATRKRAKNITQETKDKLSKSNSRSYIEIYESKEEAEKQAKIRSESRKGKKRTLEQRKRISENSGNKGKIAHNAKKVKIFGVSFNSISNACKIIGIELSAFYNIIKKNNIKNFNEIDIESLNVRKSTKEKIKNAINLYKNANSISE